MDDLVTWLHGQLDDDERIARAAGGEHPTWIQGGPDWIEDEGATMLVRPDEAGVVNDAGETVVYDEGRDPKLDTHIARHDPARVLAEVDAKRRILGDFDDLDKRIKDDGGYDTDQYTHSALEDVVRYLALPYADRPGYHDEWKP